MMRVRNTLWIMVALGLVALGATSCGLSVNLAQSGAAAYADDLYGIHDMEALREAERLLAEKAAAEKAAYEKRIAAMIAASNAEADIDDILGDLDVVESPAGTVVATSNSGGVTITHNTIYVNDYASAYARRLQGFSSLTYRMPSSYWDYRYGDAYFLTLAYDPAFYTVMVMGDQVWVEPRYITNMFGSWNNPYYYGYRYGYNPYYYGYSYGYWDYWGWNSPYWGCDPFYHYHHHHHHHWYAPHYGHHHHPHYRPGGPGGPHGGGHREHNVVHRPSYGTTIGGSTSRPSYREQLGGGVRENSRGGTQIASGTKGGNTTSIRGGGGSSARPSVTTGRPSGTTNDGGSRATGSSGRITAPTKGELSGSLSGTTIKTTPTRPTRNSGVSGSSNSSSRSSRSATTTKSSSSSRSNRSSSSVSSVRSSSSNNRSSSSSSSRSSSSVSSSRSSSSRSGYSSSSSRSSSSSNSSSRSSRR